MTKKSNFYKLLCGIILAIGLVAVPPGDDRMSASVPRILVIDPGHGGRDTGATGPTGTLEKDICLKLATMLARDLTPAYKVMLTRSADYNIDNLQRTAVANHEKADLFLSLHAGASFSRTAKGMTVYTYQPADKDESARPPEGDSRPIPWRQLQLVHLSQSRALAGAIRQALESLDQTGTFQVRQGPLTVLMGADMPAVLLEIGQLSNPETEKALTSDDQLRFYARALAGAIDIYFAGKQGAE